MNKKQWTGLLMVYISYLLLGATMFFFLEQEDETQRLEKYERYKILIEKIERLDNWVKENLTEYCGKPLEMGDINDIFPNMWDFYNAFFFVVTVVSTIGYGNLHPSTDPGRVLMVVYAVFGIPLNGILLSSLGQFFGAVFRKAHNKYKSHGGKYGKRCRLTVYVVSYLAPGLLIFIFLPAAVFAYFEDWTYIEGVYFAFVTLTTIGFGDLVAGQQRSSAHASNELLSVYKVMLIFWVIFGLGYLIMLLGFVAQAMQNKKIIQLEEKLLASVTHSKIWHGFSKDIGYLRRMMNEVYLDKLKPVFKDEEPIPQVIHRSKSLNDLTIVPGMEGPVLPRRERAMSEHVPHRHGLVKVFSETDLTRIDRKATFAAATTVPTTFELMKKVIDAYAGAHVREWPSSGSSEGGMQGVEGFSDEQVLASESWYDRQGQQRRTSRHPSSLFDVPSYEDTVSRQPHRGRAMSECPSRDSQDEQPSTNPAGGVDWTWSGPSANKLHDIIKQRSKQRLLMGLSKGRAGSISSAVITGAKKMNPLRRRRRCVTENNSQEDRINVSGDLPKHTLSVPVDIGRKRQSLPGEKLVVTDQHRDNHYMTTTAVPGGSRGDFPNHLHQLYSRGETLFHGERSKNLLEETSLADFLHVLTSLHSSVGEHLVTSNQQPKPRRKMGTASLTPPRIRSLLELFPEPTAPSTPKPPKKRKTSTIMGLFRTDSKREGNEPDATLGIGDKTAEPSNLKRLGRFLLRSYSTTPKDAEEMPRSFRKRFSLWPGDQDDKDLPPFQLQVDSPSEGSTDVTITIEPDESSSTPIYSRGGRGGAGLLFPPTETPPATRRRTNSSAASSRKPSSSK